MAMAMLHSLDLHGTHEANLQPIEILEEFGDPEVLLKEIDELYHNHPDKSKIDALWVSKNRELMRNLTDFKMGASILIPALFVLMIILHQLGII